MRSLEDELRGRYTRLTKFFIPTNSYMHTHIYSTIIKVYFATIFAGVKRTAIACNQIYAVKEST